MNDCDSADQLYAIAKMVKNYEKIMKSYTGPCNEMKTVSSVQVQKSIAMMLYHYISIKIAYLDDEYQEIINVRDFGFESFWSGVGGFVGMFLGYSLLQVPELLTSLWQNIKNRMLQFPDNSSLIS